MTVKLVDANNDALDDVFENHSDAIQYVELMGWELLSQSPRRIKVRTGNEEVADDEDYDDWRDRNGSDDY